MTDENGIDWNARQGYTLWGQEMTFKRLPKDRKRIVAEIFAKGLERYDYDNEEMVHLANYHGVPLGDILACVNYTHKVVENLNLFV